MQFTKLVAIALAALLLTAGVAAALPGDVPGHANADDHEQASDHADVDEQRNETASNESTESSDAGPPGDRSEHAQGPPTDMPDPVPDFVAEIHAVIADYLAGDIDGNPGDAVSDVANEPPEPADDGSDAPSTHYR